MKVDRIDIYHLRLVLKQPWLTAYGRESYIETVLLKAYSEGISCWVETCPLAQPYYSAETAGSVSYMIEHCFGPLLLDKNIEAASDINRLFAPYRGNSFAKAGVESIWWGLEAMRLGKALHQLFNGTSDEVEIGFTLGVQNDMDRLLARIDAAIRQGYPRVKLKIQRGRDLEILRQVRKQFSTLCLQVDCNGAYTLDDLEMFKQIDRLALSMIEQPLYYRDLADHATLQQAIDTPICLDESISNFHDAEQAVRLGACRIMNLKIGRVGGLSTAIAIHDHCRRYGIPCWVGGMLETGLGSAMNIELASLSNCIFPNDIHPSHRFFRDDLIDPPLQDNPRGRMQVATGPYLGRMVREDRVQAYTLHKHTIS